MEAREWRHVLYVCPDNDARAFFESVCNERSERHQGASKSQKKRSKVEGVCAMVNRCECWCFADACLSQCNGKS